MSTPHVIASSSTHLPQSTTSNGIVGTHYRVGKKIGEGSFGVVFEGWSSLKPFLTPTIVRPVRDHSEPLSIKDAPLVRSSCLSPYHKHDHLSIAVALWESTAHNRRQSANSLVRNSLIPVAVLGAHVFAHVQFTHTPPFP